MWKCKSQTGGVKKRLRIDEIEGLKGNKCFSSVVKIKTKSAAEVAFEKALLKKSSFIYKAQKKSKPRSSRFCGVDNSGKH